MELQRLETDHERLKVHPPPTRHGLGAVAEATSGIPFTFRSDLPSRSPRQWPGVSSTVRPADLATLSPESLFVPRARGPPRGLTAHTQTRASARVR